MKLSGPMALMRIGSSMNKFGDHMASFLDSIAGVSARESQVANGSFAASGGQYQESSALDKTPIRKQRAVRRAQAEEWMSVDQKVQFINILMKDITVVDTYEVLDDEALRKSWVLDMIF